MEGLEHVYWILGGFCSGKSSVADILAHRCGVPVFHGDDHGELRSKIDFAADPVMREWRKAGEGLDPHQRFRRFLSIRRRPGAHDSQPSATSKGWPFPGRASAEEAVDGNASSCEKLVCRWSARLQVEARFRSTAVVITRRSVVSGRSASGLKRSTHLLCGIPASSVLYSANSPTVRM